MENNYWSIHPIPPWWLCLGWIIITSIMSNPWKVVFYFKRMKIKKITHILFIEFFQTKMKHFTENNTNWPPMQMIITPIKKLLFRWYQSQFIPQSDLWPWLLGNYRVKFYIGFCGYHQYFTGHLTHSSYNSLKFIFSNFIVEGQVLDPSNMWKRVSICLCPIYFVPKI